jgi:hypothetical protein
MSLAVAIGDPEMDADTDPVPSAFKLSCVENYEPLVGAETVERILSKAD